MGKGQAEYPDIYYPIIESGWALQTTCPYPQPLAQVGPDPCVTGRIKTLIPHPSDERGKSNGRWKPESGEGEGIQPYLYQGDMASFASARCSSSPLTLASTKAKWAAM